MNILPVTRVASGQRAPHQPAPTDSRIVADHGLHVTASHASSYEREWITLVSLYHEGRKVAQIWVDGKEDSPAADDAVALLDTWRQVLVGLDELYHQENAISADAAEIEADAVLSPDSLPSQRADLRTARLQLRTLRAVTVERARLLGDRAPLVTVEIHTFNPRMPAGEARTDLARHALINWREHQDDRDAVVNEALAAGLSKSDVHRWSGIARTSKPLRAG